MDENSCLVCLINEKPIFFPFILTSWGMFIFGVDFFFFFSFFIFFLFFSHLLCVLLLQFIIRLFDIFEIDVNSLHARVFSVYLTKIIFVNLFYYLTYFYHYLLVLLYFLVLFISFIILFWLTFTFI